MIVIVDYGLGNLRSIQNMLRRVGAPSVITSDPAAIAKAEKLILPGVGHFKYGMDCLRERGLIEPLNRRVLGDRIPTLGICLGAQLIGRHSQEGDAEGLGWVPIDTVAFDRSRLGPKDRVPHMGWADTRHTGHPLFAGQAEPPRFYYVHSFHMVCDDPATAICTAHHGYEFTSGVARGNVMGVQFHPEKSHLFGLQLLKTFAAMDARALERAA
jgi:imidazole glycerol-phosphate synthase subunit HisH